MDSTSDEEEEVILMVELSGCLDTIKECTETCSILGLNSSEPILQLDKHVFKGKYSAGVGTTMVFKEEGKSLQYLCKTEKKLVMQRVILKSKQQEQPQTSLSTKPVAAVPSAAATTLTSSSSNANTLSQEPLVLETADT